MCGGINLSQCVSYKVPENASKAAKLKPSLMYNTGRVISYTVIGGIVGGLGSVISFSGTAKGIVAILAGVFMLIMGLNMTGLFPWLRKIVPHMPKRFANKARMCYRRIRLVVIFTGGKPVQSVVNAWTRALLKRYSCAAGKRAWKASWKKCCVIGRIMLLQEGG
jgi:sulfite exporter TauE/SafE